MSIKVTCPDCGAKLNAPERSEGGMAKCHQCKNTFRIPYPVAEVAPPSSAATLPQPVYEKLDVLHPEAFYVPPAVQHLVACPYCAEGILADARKCRFCGEILDVDLKRARRRRERGEDERERVTVNVHNRLEARAEARATAKARAPFFSSCGCVLLLILSLLVGGIVLVGAVGSVRQAAAVNQRPK